MSAIRFQFDDGGRAAAGFRGTAGDCVCRAIAIASGRPYREVYEDLTARTKAWLAEPSRGWRKRLYKAQTARDGASPRNGCDSCYARTWALRYGIAGWGPHAERVPAAPAAWKKPLAWQRRVERGDPRRFVFPVFVDPFDNRAPVELRARLFETIKATPGLVWLLLTKRPQNMRRMLPADWGDGYPNCWPGVTAENQREANRRLPILCRTPAVRRFVSCEPLLEPVDLRPWLGSVDWVIAGCESGPGKRPGQRPTEPDWLRNARLLPGRQRLLLAQADGRRRQDGRSARARRAHLARAPRSGLHAMTGDRKSQVKLTELWERVSARGTRYFSGYLNGNSLLLFSDGEKPHPGRPGGTVHVWNLVLQERDQGQRPSATRNAERGQRVWDRSREVGRAHAAGEAVLAAAKADRQPEPPQSWIDDSEAAIRDLEGRDR